MEDELKANALSMGSKGQHELRKTIIRMLKDGKRGTEIAKELGVSEGHVSNVKKLYEMGGAKALKPAKRGRPAGKNKILTPEQERERVFEEMIWSYSVSSNKMFNSILHFRNRTYRFVADLGITNRRYSIRHRNAAYLRQSVGHLKIIIRDILRRHRFKYTLRKLIRTGR